MKDHSHPAVIALAANTQTPNHRVLHQAESQESVLFQALVLEGQ